MELLISLFVFGAAFAAMAVGALRGRPLGSRRCGACPHRPRAEGGSSCRP